MKEFLNRQPEPKKSSFFEIFCEKFESTNTRFIFAGICFIGVLILYFQPILELKPEILTIIIAFSYFFGGIHTLVEVIHHGLKLDIEVDLLMLLSALGAGYIGQWKEGVVLLFLFSFSESLLSYVYGRMELAVIALMELRPSTVEAYFEYGTDSQKLMTVPIDAIEIGDIFAIKPGERVPVDGVILKGFSEIDESSVTGESFPVVKNPDDLIVSGTLNKTGFLEVKATSSATDSTISRIIELVKHAQENKNKTQSFIEKSEKFYVICVLILVPLYALLVPQIFGVTSEMAFYTALTLLTVMAPCALVLSIPATILCTIGVASRNGILFKGGSHIERISQISAIGFDKTGTITTGKPKVHSIIPYNSLTENEVLRYAISLEQYSEHPIAFAIMQIGEERGLKPENLSEFQAVIGRGIRGIIDEKPTFIGTLNLLSENNIEVSSEILEEIKKLEEKFTGTSLLVAHDGKVCGVIGVFDEVREEAVEAIKLLREVKKIKHLAILSGDSHKTVSKIGLELNLDSAYGGLLPNQKLDKIKELQQNFGITAMVGDGINDAPSLATADIGIAMGGQLGSDVAMETADLILMKNDLRSVAFAIKVAKKAQSIIWQNLFISLSVILILTVFTILGKVNIPIGVLGHEGSTIIVLFNSLRLFTMKIK